MAARQKTDRELKEKFRRVYGKEATVMEFLQFKKHYAPFDPYKEEETKHDEREQIPFLETEDDDSVFLDD
jgi:hypothetical protein